MYLRHRSDWRYALLLAALIMPLAIAANLCRLMLLLVLVHVEGAAVLDTPLHLATGMMMVGMVMILLAALDVAMAPVRVRLARGRAR